MAERTIGGRYRLLDRLGKGGMAEVWKAEDLDLERHVAVKLLGADADRERFEREARLLAAIAHPNVVRLFDYGEDDGVPFMVLELLPEGSLDDQLDRGGAVSDADAARLASEIAAGLAAAHAHGLVHRDLKPSNILFDAEQRAKIADFGIARSTGAGTLTDPGTVLGTAAYISPEQAAGEPASPASDVYSFGVILYRLLAGRLPFESADVAELLEQHQHVQPPPIPAARPDAPPALERVALNALAKDPAARPADGAALLAALERSPAAAETTAVIPVPRRRFPRAAALVLALLAVGGAGAALAIVASSGDGGSSGPPPDRTLDRVTPATTAADSPPPAGPTTTPTRTTTKKRTAPVPTVPPPLTTIEPIPTIDTQITAPTEPLPTEPLPPPPPEPPPTTDPTTTVRP